MFESGCLRTIWLSETPEGKYSLRENGAKFRKDAVIEANQGATGEEEFVEEAVEETVEE